MCLGALNQEVLAPLEGISILWVFVFLFYVAFTRPGFFLDTLGTNSVHLELMFSFGL